jgi:PadR family transcriptional regulator, regulatory protein PadR
MTNAAKLFNVPKDRVGRDAPTSKYGGAPTDLLGRFEYSLLRAIEILGTDAYGAQLGRYLSEKLSRDVTAPQVYMTLERLAKRGLVRSENTDPVPARGGRSRKRFMIEAGGVRALRHTAAALNAIPASEDGRDDPTEQIEITA